MHLHDTQKQVPADRPEDRVLSILHDSACGAGLLRFAGFCGVSAGVDPLLEPGDCWFYPRHNRFDLGWQPEEMAETEKFLCRRLSGFTAGLRRAWHHHLGHGAAENTAPADFLFHHRVAGADVQAVTTQTAWELRHMGHDFFWRWLAASENGDMTAVFAAAVSRRPQAQFDGSAARVAFDAWFSVPARVDACDRAALEVCDMRFLNGGYGRGCAPAWRSQACDLGLLPGGRNYLAGCQFFSGRYEGLSAAENREYLAWLESDIRRSLLPAT